MRPIPTRALSLAAIVIAGRAAHADPTADAQQQFEQGVAAATGGDWERARTAFEVANRLAPRPVVVLNLAGAQAKTGRLADAAQNYRRYLADPEADPELRPAAEQVLAKLEPRVPRIRFVIEAARGDEQLALDGAEVAPATLAGDLRLNPGLHTLVVRRSTRELARIVADAVEGKTRTIVVTVPAEPTAPPSTPAAERPSGVWKSPWLWATAGAAVVGAAVGVALYARDRDPYVGNLPPGHVSVR